MPARNAEPPTREEIQAFALGKLDSPRAGEIELYLGDHPELVAVLEATPDDEVVRPLRGARIVPQPRARSPLLELAVEGVLPVLGGCAGALAGGPEGGLLGVVAGQAAEKAINFFGKQIVEKWLGWLRKQPPGMQAAALTQLAEMLPEVARSEVSAVLEKQAPNISPADRQVAIEYLSAIPRSVRRLATDRPGDGRKKAAAEHVDGRLALSAPAAADGLAALFGAPTALPGTEYRLEELIGSGGFGAVYRASAPSLQHLPLAIKFCLDGSLLPAQKQERANLERLMQAGGEAWSPHLVRLYGYNLDHRTPHLVYEYVSGGDLVLDERPRDAGELLRLISPLGTRHLKAVETGLPPAIPAPERDPLLSVSPGQDSAPFPGLPQSTQESYEFRYFRFSTALRKLQECHRAVTAQRAATPPVVEDARYIVLVLPAMGICASLGGAFVYETTSGVFPNSVRWICGIGTAVFIGAAILAGHFLHVSWHRKTQRRVEQNLAFKIEELLAEFPQECQTWGGRAALADAEVLKKIIEELEPPKE